MERYDYLKIKYKTSIFQNGFRNILNFSDGLARVTTKDDYTGYIDKSGKLVIPYKKDLWFASSFFDGIAIINYGKNARGLYLYEFINKEGNTLFTLECEELGGINPDKFVHGLILIKQKNHYGAINKNGELVIPCIYDEEFIFIEGLAAVCKDGKYGYINEMGETVIDFIYDKAIEFRDGYAIVRKKLELFYIDKNGKKVLDCNDSYSFSEGLAPIKRNKLIGYINKLGEVVIPCEYYEARTFINGIAIVRGKNRKYGCINKKGEIVVPCLYDNIFRDSSGFSVEKDKKYGWIGENQSEFIPIIYDNIVSFQDGLAPVRKDGKYGYINTKNEIVIPFKFRNAYKFSEGRAIVVTEDGVDIIDERGKLISDKNNEHSMFEDTCYIGSKWDIPNGAKEIEIMEYLSAFQLDAKIIWASDSDYNKYRKKVKAVENIIEEYRTSDLDDIYQEVLARKV